MDTNRLKKFAQYARRELLKTIAIKLERVLGDRIIRDSYPEAIAELEKAILSEGKDTVIDRVAYTWFNRFCALRFMDAKGYNSVRVVSPLDGEFQPEILAEAKMGVFGSEIPEDIQKRVLGLLNGSEKSDDPQTEVYRLLIVAVCNSYYQLMPFMFEKIDDYTELLMPDDLLSGNSILAFTREAMTPENCESVECLGWLYQFYISEKKDDVFAALKKGKKISSENIPAATQLFTPSWIVKYLVENSLGRLWMLNRPQSKLIERMEYYIAPESSPPLLPKERAGERLSSEEHDLPPQPPLVRGENTLPPLLSKERAGERLSSDGVPPQPPLVREENTLPPLISKERVGERLSSEGHDLPPQPPLVRGEHMSEDFLRVDSPEDLKICDPACGSGHMLVYAFDLLYAIYEEEGYSPSEIPAYILTKNLYGIEIDSRAGSLAAFALVMKAREKFRRFFKKSVVPNICVLENVIFEEGELGAYLDFVGRDLFTASLQQTLHEFREAETFGALIRPTVADVKGIRSVLRDRNVEGQLLLYKTHEKVLRVLRQAEFLAPKYQVIIANPPYMGSKGMNPKLSAWVKKNYPNSKSDLFAIFTERILDFVPKGGFIGLMTPFTWMFLSSYEKLRSRLLNEATITSLVRPEYHAFFESAYVPICAFTLFHQTLENYKGGFVDLQDFYGADVQPIKALEAIKNPDCGWFYRASAADFKKIPGAAIAYQISPQALNAFNTGIYLRNILDARIAMATGDNNSFIRDWSEIDLKKIGLNINSENESIQSGLKWFPCNKGGSFRKWYGNNETLVNWLDGGKEIRSFSDVKTGRIRSHNYNGKFAFQESINWSALSSSNLGVRYSPLGFMFVTPASSAFIKNNSKFDFLVIHSFLCSKIADYFLRIISATMNIEVGNILSIPFISPKNKNIDLKNIAHKSIHLEKIDWDSYETSWDFTSLPILSNLHDQKLATQYNKLRQHWAEMTQQMQQLEDENNRIFIEAYGLQDELTPEVPLKEITLTCNPHYRYNADKPEVELEALLLADTLREYISYAVGCMFGRYSLDKEGLILANQGETLTDYQQQIPQPTFTPNQNNVIPILEGDWFSDDITEQFKQFLRITFGVENYSENLKFIETALGKKIEKYFLNDFYNDHIKRYKKRPIYWLFSSPKGTFNALIYLHRYQPDTASIVLNEYLREFTNKLASRQESLEQITISTSTSASEKTKALKEIDKLKKAIRELSDYERETLYPLATKQIEIDLDDSVKRNYPKFGKALKKVTGLS